ASGDRVAIGGLGESSEAVGIDADLSLGGADESGAVAVFDYDGTGWLQTRTLKAPNSDEEDQFGEVLSLSGDGATLVVGATEEDGASEGIAAGIDNDNSRSEAGAVYIY
ncbi:MAG: integrin, partial [Pseudomonadota bacterium]